nr:MAG TPA: Protein of unknown function (DUF4523) [Caudoviricetes sp.]
MHQRLPLHIRGAVLCSCGSAAQKRKAVDSKMKSTAFLVRRKGLEPPTYWFVVVRFPYHIFS